jgi:hypothetical protein
MRTTVALDDDVTRALETVRRERGIGLSEAVNQLVRAGLAHQTGSRRRVPEQRTADLGIRVDISNVAEALELLDESDGGTRAP